MNYTDQTIPKCNSQFIQLSQYHLHNIPHQGSQTFQTEGVHSQTQYKSYTITPNQYSFVRKHRVSVFSV